MFFQQVPQPRLEQEPVPQVPVPQVPVPQVPVPQVPVPQVPLEQVPVLPVNGQVPVEHPLVSGQVLRGVVTVQLVPAMGQVTVLLLLLLLQLFPPNKPDNPPQPLPPNTRDNNRTKNKRPQLSLKMPQFPNNITIIRKKSIRLQVSELQPLVLQPVLQPVLQFVLQPPQLLNIPSKRDIT